MKPLTKNRAEDGRTLTRPRAKPGAQRGKKREKKVDKNFRNPLEGNAEYILIPGGTIKYSVTKKTEKVPDLYFTKYPVTNKQYRRFIDFIAGAGNERLKLEKFVNSLRMSANHSADVFISYLSRDAKHWAKILCSRYADNHRFSGDDQPVVGVTWFAAQAYCWWLSEMQGSWEWYYRLPTENEWEWSASGGKRKYPWGN